MDYIDRGNYLNATTPKGRKGVLFIGWNLLTDPLFIAQEPTLLTYIREDPGSTFDWGTNCTDQQQFRTFPQFSVYRDGTVLSYTEWFGITVMLYTHPGGFWIEPQSLHRISWQVSPPFISPCRQMQG
jgi:hypothetical protein